MYCSLGSSAASISSLLLVLLQVILLGAIAVVSASPVTGPETAKREFPSALLLDDSSWIPYRDQIGRGEEGILISETWIPPNFIGADRKEDEGVSPIAKRCLSHCIIDASPL